jgi:glycolate oxidase FAD binding subunit
MLKTSFIDEKLRSAVGSQNLREAAVCDMISGLQPQFVAEPEDERQLASLLAAANQMDISVVPRGGGTKLDWGNPPNRVEVILSTARLNRVLEHGWADLTVTVEAGCTLQALQSTLARHGQRLACDCLWPERATIGGVLSTNDSGVWRLRFGALRDLIIGVTLALANGTLASSGGKVVKNVAGYDLPKLATGAFGTLGVITRAIFRLHPLPRSAKSLSFMAEDFLALQRHVLSIQNSKLAHTALQMRCAGGAKPHAEILFEATEAGIEAQELQLRKLIGSTSVEQCSDSVWNARQEIWNSRENEMMTKISFLPADIAKTLEATERIANSQTLQWQIVAQATGIGVLRLGGGSGQIAVAVRQLRAEAESNGGSLVILRAPNDLDPIDAWGNTGDTVGLMRAVKQQLDPKGILNPGRFAAGI